MLDIKKNLEGSRMEFVLDGRLDTITAPQLEEEVKASIDGITELILTSAVWLMSPAPDSVCFCQRRKP